MRRRSALLALLALAFASISFAQNGPVDGRAGVPPIIRINGTLAAEPGRVPVTFGLYQDESGGAPLWVESQIVMVDGTGRYSVVLGMTTPLPTGVFASGEARWLDVAVEGLAPQPRRLLVSVPYALQAADAETIGGKPLSAFVLAGEKTGVGADGLTYVDTRVLASGLASGGNCQAPGGAGTPNFIGMFSDATTLINSVIYQAAGSVGVNTTAPLAGFHAVSAASPVAFYDVYSNALGALPVVYRAARGTPASPTAVQANDILGGLAVRGYGSTAFSTGRGQVMYKAAENWTDSANGTYLQFTTTPLGTGAWAERMRIAPDGKVGIGTATPAQLLSVAGTVESTTGGFRFPDGTTQTTAATGGSGGVTRVYGGDGISITGALTTPIVNAQFGGSGGDFGVAGTTARGDHLHGATYVPVTGGAVTGPMTVTGSASPLPMLGVTNTSGGSAAVLGTTTHASGIGVSGVANAASGAGSVGVYGESTAGKAVAGQSTSGYGVYGNVTSGRGVSGIATSGYGVYGYATTGYAGLFEGNVNVTGKLGAGHIVPAGGSLEVDGVMDVTAGTVGTPILNVYNALLTGSLSNYGTAVKATAGGDFGLAVDAEAFGSNGTAGYFRSHAGQAVRAVGQGGEGGYFQSDVSWAGRFWGETGLAGRFVGRVETTGDLSVGGTLTKAAGSFKIDHPLDPENKYLSHSFVESPDMKNIYDGVAVLDEKGEAAVALPEWFEALNRDFRYQLTSIGAFMPVFVADEVAGNRFRIAGGTPGKKVSWQVTGIRRDAYARAHPIPVEEAKPVGEQGTYLHPEAFGQPKEKGLAAASEPDRKAPLK
jgi:trimeric autotransporter adhesin